MKTFTAKELNKSPAQVFRAADKDGEVEISHDRYPDKRFVLEARERVPLTEYKVGEKVALPDGRIFTVTKVCDDVPIRNLLTNDGE